MVEQVRKKYGQLEMALVIPMQSFRKTISKVFKNIKGLSPKMVIGPAEVTRKKYDLLIVDEGHRLRRRTNLSSYIKQLQSQFRVKGGAKYMKLIHQLFSDHNNMTPGPFESGHYDLQLFEDIGEMEQQIQKKERTDGLARMVAGFAWDWISKKDKSLYDIVIGETKLQWNK